MGYPAGQADLTVVIPEGGAVEIPPIVLGHILIDRGTVTDVGRPVSGADAKKDKQPRKPFRLPQGNVEAEASPGNNKGQLSPWSWTRRCRLVGRRRWKRPPRCRRKRRGH